MAAQVDGDNAMIPTEECRLRCKEGVIAAPPMYEKKRRCPAAKLFVSESDAIALHDFHGKSFTSSSKAGNHFCCESLFHGVRPRDCSLRASPVIEFRCPVTGRLRKPIFISLEASSNHIAAIGEQAVARNKS